MSECFIATKASADGIGSTIAKQLSIPVISDSSTQDLYRGIRQQLASLLGGVDTKDLNTMSLGLGHSMSRFKLKFSTDKVDTMVIQAIALLDDLDKEINIYSMRVKVRTVQYRVGINADSSGMVRMALPGNGQNYCRQSRLRKGRQGYG